jgi:hypothetical protein
MSGFPRLVVLSRFGRFSAMGGQKTRPEEDQKYVALPDRKKYSTL